MVYMSETIKMAYIETERTLGTSANLPTMLRNEMKREQGW